MIRSNISLNNIIGIETRESITVVIRFPSYVIIF